MLEDEGVLEHIKMGEYHLGLLPFDSDLLTLEMGVAFKHVRNFVHYYCRHIKIFGNQNTLLSLLGLQL